MLRRPAHCLAVALATGVLWCASCLSPTLPLPPPEEPDTITQTHCDGDVCDWQIAGTCDPGFTVYLTNLDTGNGVTQDDRNSDGRYLLVLRGARCALVGISQENNEGERSTEATFLLAPRKGGTEIDPSACK